MPYETINLSKHLNTKSYIVIFGAAVLDNGEPSGAMLRRVKSALIAAQSLNNIVYVVSGGVGSGKSISEAEVMQKILMSHGVSLNNIILEQEAGDTLASIKYCTTILKSEDAKHIFVCSDTYHIPRCRWLFYLYGLKTKAVKAISGLPANGFLKWTYYYVRELAATAYDTFLVKQTKLTKKDK